MAAYFHDYFTVTCYPAGERHIEAIPDVWPLRGEQIVAEHVRDFNGIMDCVVAQDILDRTGNGDVQWVVPYMPYARHDRRNHRLDGLELTHAINMLSSIGASIIDPHSDVSGVLPHYTQAQVVAAFKEKGLFDHNPIVAIPDAGAAKKAHSWLGELDYVQCVKKRNPLTGRLSAFQVVADIEFNERPVVIVDDLCDAGGTFLGLAAELALFNTGPLHLAVTHGLFTKGLDTLFGVFDQIYTLDIYATDSRLTSVSINDLIRRNTPT